MKLIALAILTLGVLAISAWLEINNKSADGWVVIAFCLILTTCNSAVFDGV